MKSYNLKYPLKTFKRKNKRIEATKQNILSLKHEFNDKLMKYGWDHYNFLNQIFGCDKVRESIQSIYNIQNYEFKTVYNEIFRGDHHIVFDKQNNKNLCSVELGYQNLKKNKNDTLCAFWSLLIMFEKKITKNQYTNQMKMIQLARSIIKNPDFIKSLIVLMNDYDLNWKINKYKSKSKPMKMEINYIIDNVNRVLDDWENYGLLYFIGNGSVYSYTPLNL